MHVHVIPSTELFLAIEYLLLKVQSYEFTYLVTLPISQVLSNMWLLWMVSPYSAFCTSIFIKEHRFPSYFSLRIKNCDYYSLSIFSIFQINLFYTFFNFYSFLLPLPDKPIIWLTCPRVSCSSCHWARDYSLFWIDCCVRIFPNLCPLSL